VFESNVNTPDPAGAVGADGHFMDRAIDLAWLGAGWTPPNPLVGAVAVKDGHVVGTGYHERYGEAHAETVALGRAGDDARGSTLYVTLEPCCHHGNTPPCVEAIVRSGVKRVVIPILDPDERVNGRGVRYLRENGVRVDVGVGRERALLLNARYLKRKLGLGTSVTLKMAVTLDGRIASRRGGRDTITGDEARRLVHRFRAANDAVAIGVNTLAVDSPLLDCRLLDGAGPPVPVVFDSKLSFPIDHPWLHERSAVIVTGNGASASKEEQLKAAGGRVVRCPAGDGGVDIEAAVKALSRLGIESILVEGGARLFTSFLNSGAWDGLYMFVSPALFGGEGVAVSNDRIDRDRLNAELAGTASVADDVLLSFINKNTMKSLLDRLA
jgi:diaminohydroxyphosphoribosylaminopyrimidine deaminase/5-amino-6-(5-phosphoribosylamino)uracil reductase